VLFDQSTNHITVRDRLSGTQRRKFAIMQREEMQTMALSPDEKFLLIGTIGSAVRVWELATGKELPVLGGHKGLASNVALSHDSKKVVTGGLNSDLHVWDWPSGRLRRKVPLGNLCRNGIENLAVSADGERAEVVFRGEVALRMFDLKTCKEMPQAVEAHRGPIHSLATTRDGGLVTLSADNTIRIWDLRTGRHLRELPIPHPFHEST